MTNVVPLLPRGSTRAVQIGESIAPDLLAIARRHDIPRGTLSTWALIVAGDVLREYGMTEDEAYRLRDFAVGGFDRRVAELLNHTSRPGGGDDAA